MADKATHGYRVLLVAQRSVTDQTTVQDDRALTLLGYLTFLDLPKPDAADTIAHMHNAGITVTMLTGDDATSGPYRRPESRHQCSTGGTSPAERWTT